MISLGAQITPDQSPRINMDKEFIMNQKTPITIQGALLALAATVLWSGNFIVARAVTSQVSPVTLACLRWLVATVVLLPFGLRALKSHWALARKHWLYFLTLSLCGQCLFSVLTYTASLSTNALNMTLIATSSPILTLILARFMLKERLGVLKIIGILSALTGVIYLTIQGNLELLWHMEFRTGDLLSLAAAIFFAIYNIQLHYRPVGVPNNVFLILLFLFSFLCTLPLTGLEYILGHSYFTLSAESVLSVLYISVAASLVGLWLWNKSVSDIGPANAIVFYYCLPLFSGLGALIFLGEPITMVHLVSAVLILAGTIVAARA